MIAPALRAPLHNRRSVLEIIETTRAIRWWIDQQIEQGRTDDEIAAMLPLAVAVITGRVPLAEIEAALR